ncbi:MAG: hypothetical protein KJ645_00340, partial [Planctomycetes bacterium]|nr:hypothetical protein [Planctomycetota bacterium]
MMRIISKSIYSGVASLMIWTILFFSGNALGSGMDDGLVAYWPFDEMGGDIAYDASGNGHDLSLVYTEPDGTLYCATWSPGIVGDGAISTREGIAYCAHSEDLELNESYSISVWVIKDGDSSALMNTVVSKHWCYQDSDGSWEMAYKPDPEGSYCFREFVAGYGKGSWYGTFGASHDGSPIDPIWGDIGVEIPWLEAAPAAMHLALTYDDMNQMASVYINGLKVKCGPWTSAIGGCQALLT